ncbi:MAG TPA: BzdV protein, partial [Armatimonadetes bacterium]|nr:BzdV protein [Armatimonadota bacterium]
MKKMLTVTIDGIQVDVEEGATVLEAAQRAGVYIPTLCYHPCLPPIGACRLCAVEVEGMKGIHTACTLPCTDGMVVHTDTPAIKRFRQDILWLILSEHPHACLICEKRDECDLKTCEFDIPVEQRCCSKWNECELKEIVDAVGLPEDIPLPEYKSRGFPVIEDEPLIFIDRNLCILCERCIRACQDLRGIGAIGFIYRGRNSMTAPPPNMNLSESGCRFCCTCVEVCPSGALRDKVDFNGKPREEVIIACKYACPARIDVPRYVRLI